MTELDAIISLLPPLCLVIVTLVYNLFWGFYITYIRVPLYAWGHSLA